jgi:hypothetical protein
MSVRKKFVIPEGVLKKNIIGWCYFTHTPNLKKNPIDRGGYD